MTPGFPRPFGNYVLLGQWASGGMGEIYLARIGNLEGATRICLVKTLRGDLAREPEYASRFIDEARVVIHLQHSGICQVFDAGRVDGVPYIAMELVRGVDLRRFVDTLHEAGRGIGEGIALWIGAEILDALDVAHRCVDVVTNKPLDIVHRDVSPHNVLLSFEGEIKLIDFGLALSTLKESQTESHVVMGKVAYMAPEQARGEETDKSVDQFAAAVLIYELLAGDRYYGDMTSYQIWQVVGRGDHIPRRWGQLDPEIAAALRPALARADQRFSSCGELAGRLRALLARRHPMTGRAALQSLLALVFKDQAAQVNERIAQMSSALANAPTVELPPSISQLPAAQPSTSNFAWAAAPTIVEPSTGATQTVQVARSRRRSATLAGAMICVALLAAGAYVLRNQLMVHAPPPVDGGAPPVVTAATAPTASTAAPLADAGPQPVVVAPPQIPLEPVAADPGADPTPPPKSAAKTTKARKKKNLAATLSRERKLDLLRMSNALCAQGVNNMANPPDRLIDDCVDDVFGK